MHNIKRRESKLITIEIDQYKRRQQERKERNWNNKTARKQ